MQLVEHRAAEIVHVEAWLSDMLIVMKERTYACFRWVMAHVSDESLRVVESEVGGDHELLSSSAQQRIQEADDRGGNLAKVPKKTVLIKQLQDKLNNWSKWLQP